MCGILRVNMAPVTHFGWDADLGPATLDTASGWLQLLVQQRFFPIFSVLFGMGSTLFLQSAARRAAHPSGCAGAAAARAVAAGDRPPLVAAALPYGGIAVIPGLFLLGSALVR